MTLFIWVKNMKNYSDEAFIFTAFICDQRRYNPNYNYGPTKRGNTIQAAELL
jgi:hypothetical protein